MLFFLCLSAGVGFFINEEASLRRICRNLECPNEGWLILTYSEGLYLLILTAIVAFAKGYGWSAFVQYCFPQGHLLSGLGYVLANFWAVKKSGGLGFSPWLGAVGFFTA